MKADGSDFVRLRQEDGVVLDWTPDGRRILLSADQSFLSVRPDGSGERVFLAKPPEGGRLVIDWSPDGDWIRDVDAHGDRQRGLRLSHAGRRGHVFRITLGAEPSWRPQTG